MHITQLNLENTSATAPLKLFTQALSQGAPDVEHCWITDPTQAWVAPRNGNERLELVGGRRYVLAGSGGARVEVHGSHSIRTTELALEDGEWVETEGPTIAARTYTTLELKATHRIALKIGSVEDSESAVRLTNRSDCAVQIIRQEVGRMLVTPSAATWGVPTEAGLVPAGGKKQVQVHDTSRLVIETNSKEDVVLSLGNANQIHSMRLHSFGNISILEPAKAGQTRSACVTVNAKHKAIVEQLPA